MTNPYDVLGINSSASDDEVKEAYRNLVTKYHPDSYAESPLKDVAVQKKKEIDEAFELIMNERRLHGPVKGQTVDASATSHDSYQASGGDPSSSSNNLGDIRRMIQQNRLVEAEELLDGVPANMRDGEWYFLKGSIYFSRGWLEDAANHFSSACRLNPNNPEYRAAMNRIMWQKQGNFGNGYNNNPNPYRTTQNAGGCSACDMCSGLICADCCCECMGGDLISCC